MTLGRAATGAGQDALPGRAVRAACAAVVALEMIGSLLMWAPIPVGWMWIGARVYDATGSFALDGLVVLAGFLATTILAMRSLARLDDFWVRLRRRAGYDQVGGALTQVVVISATLGLLSFMVWYYLLSHAFILPFMPSQ